jgi:tetratricopeptide (TPR) repeat protein
LPVAYLELAKVLHALGRIPEANDAYREAIGLLEQYVTSFPRIAEYWVHLYDGYANRMRLLEQTGNSEEAAHVSDRALDLYERLVARLPEEIADQGVPRIATGLDAVLKSRGRLQEQERGYRHALEVSERLAARYPTSPGYRFHAAYWHNALGALLMAAGRTPEAANAYRHVVEQSLAQDTGNSEAEQLVGFRRIFRAMALWQLGHKEEARLWYDQAVEWMEKNQPNNDQLRRFRAEAEELLRIKDKTPSEPKKGSR